jgi:hypothetical protein
MFIVRLFFGLLKGLIIGGLVGWGLAAAGMTGAAFAYGGAAVVGVLVAMIAGKPIWADDSRIQVILKMVAGALLAPGLLLLVRKFLPLGLPFDTAILPGVASIKNATIGGFALTSLATVGAVLAAFYDADNSESKNSDTASSKGPRIEASAEPKRVASQSSASEIAAITGLDAAEIQAIENDRKNG